MFRIGLILLLFLASSNEKMYHREYHQNGQLKAQGWKLGDSKENFWKYYFPNGVLQQQGHYKMNRKTGYWYFYNTSGRLEMEGHMVAGKMVKWWLFYDENEKINHKCQLQDGIKNGYCLKYKDEKLTSAEKYHQGKKVKEWFTFSSFRKENKLSDLK